MSAPETIGHPSHASENPRRSRLLWSHLEKVRSFRMNHYYHASEYIYKLSEALFSDARRAQAWARKMCRWLKRKPRGIYRVLHSAAAIRRRIVVGEKRKQYHKAYDYLRKRIRFLEYFENRRNHLPIGSGVTEFDFCPF